MDKSYQIRVRQDNEWIDLGEVNLSEEMVEHFIQATRNTNKILVQRDPKKDEEQ